MNLKLAAGALALSTLAPSCLGPNNVFNSLNTWNANVSESDVAREALFLGMAILSVYAIGLMSDWVIFNTIDYWSGSNPISPAAAWPDNFSNK